MSKVLCNGGYSGEKFAGAVRKLMEAEVEVIKRNEQYEFAVLPRRRIVGRSFAWLEKYRRFWKNCERKLRNTLQMTVLAFISLILRRF
jgi:transposase